MVARVVARGMVRNSGELNFHFVISLFLPKVGAELRRPTIKIAYVGGASLVPPPA